MNNIYENNPEWNLEKNMPRDLLYKKVTKEIFSSYESGEIDKETLNELITFLLGDYIEDQFSGKMDNLMYRYQKSLFSRSSFGAMNN